MAINTTEKLLLFLAKIRNNDGGFGLFNVIVWDPHVSLHFTMPLCSQTFLIIFAVAIVRMCLYISSFILCHFLHANFSFLSSYSKRCFNCAAFTFANAPDDCQCHLFLFCCISSGQTTYRPKWEREKKTGEIIIVIMRKNRNGKVWRKWQLKWHKMMLVLRYCAL